MSDYPVSPRNRIKRVGKRGSYDRATVHAILDSALMCHVAYVLDGQPYCTPTIHWREGETLYWHGSSASRMLRAQEQGARVCLAVSHLDGLVLARSGFNHSVNYRSAMVFGTAHLVEDPAEQERALLAITQRFYPGRNEELRPMTTQEIKATTVIAMGIEEAAAKIRAANVGDDEEDGHLPVWAGVIPVSTVIGAPQPSPVLPKHTPLPAHLAAYEPGRRLDAALQETQAIYEKG